MSGSSSFGQPPPAGKTGTQEQAAASTGSGDALLLLAELHRLADYHTFDVGPAERLDGADEIGLPLELVDRPNGDHPDRPGLGDRRSRAGDAEAVGDHEDPGGILRVDE